MMKCWQKSMLTLLVFVLIEIAIYMHFKNNENYGQLLNYDLSAAISQYKNGTVSAIDFANITTFPWDRLYVVGPYTSPSKIDNVLGTFWLDSRFTTIASNDRITLLIFMNHGHVVRYFEYPRYLGDFVGAVTEKGYGYQEARFILGKDGKMIWTGK
jgi:hypothetical protein